MLPDVIETKLFERLTPYFQDPMVSVNNTRANVLDVGWLLQWQCVACWARIWGAKASHVSRTRNILGQ